MTLLLLFVLSVTVTTEADYVCVCNQISELGIHEKPLISTPEVGYMYTGDCSQQVLMSNVEPQWIALVYNHKIGYVLGSNVHLKKCAGSPPDPQLLTITTSTTAAATTTTTSTTTTAKPTTTTSKPTTTTTTASTTTTPKSTPTTPKPTTTAPTTTTTTTPTPKTTTTTTFKPITTTPKLTTTTTTTPKPTTTTPRSTTATTMPPKPTTTTTSTPKPTTTTFTTTTPTTTTSTTTTPTTTTLKPTTTTPKPTTTMTTTSKPTTITTTTPTPTTSTPRPTTPTATIPKPTTPTSKPTSTRPSYGSPCYDTYLQYSRNIKGTLTSYGQNCYEFVTATLTWSAAETDCRTKRGNLVHISNVQEQNFIYNFLKSQHNHRVWIGLHDRQTEEVFQWISGDSVNYTHWSLNRYSTLHAIQDCVELDPDDNGFWKDKDCSTVIQQHYGYVCQYGGSSSTHAPITHASITHASVTHAPATHTPVANQSGSDGNTHMCSSRQRSHTQKHDTTLSQYGNSCYELMPAQRMTWQHAETLCQSGGGHLAHIRNAAEQTFIQGFMQRHSPDHAAWIGLHDLMYEGHYQWSSGDSVTYTNFIAGHLNNYADRHVENCFAIIPYKGGKWDDIPCGSSNFFGQDYGEIHPMLCQFPIATASLIG